MVKHLLLLGIVFFGCLHAGDAQLKQKMIKNLEAICADFEENYAPKEWKKESINWNLEEQYQIAKEEILNTDNISTNDYQRILSRFFHSCRDFHVSVHFFSTARAKLPFMFKEADNRFFVVYVDHEKLDQEMNPIFCGDELISIDDRPVLDVIKQFEQELFGTTDEGTERSVATVRFTTRLGERGMSVPSGPISFGVRTEENGAIREVNLCWDYQTELIENHVDLNTEHTPRLDDLLFLAEDDTNPFLKGSRDGFLPPLGKVIWKTDDDDFFQAYIYQTREKDLVGFLRIPNYMPFIQDFFCMRLIEIISKFEDATDLVVIDQTNNPGGSVGYLYSIASMFATSPLKTPRHRFTINQAHVLDALIDLRMTEQIENNSDAEEFFGNPPHSYPASYQFAQFYRNYCHFVIDQWNKGKKLTDPYFIWGVDAINSHPKVCYKGPLLILIDELDFSGGDFFPAIMQDNKRAVIMGTKTAGAGGYVRERGVSNSLGIAGYRLTESIAERIDKTPLETNGVTPDILYKHTVDDLRFGFGDYAAAVNEVVKAMLHGEDK